MTWTECKDHPAVYCDASFYKKCPACENQSLYHAFKISQAIESKYFEFIIHYAAWVDSFIDCLSPSDSKVSMNERLKKKDSRLEDALAAARAIGTHRNALRKYICRHELNFV